MPGDVLALLELLVDLGRLLLALLQRLAVVSASAAAFVGRRRRRAVLRRVLAGGRRVVFLAVLGGLALFLGGRATGDVGAREWVVVDVVAGAARPGLPFAVGGACWGVGGGAADFGRERRVEEARELAGVAVGEFVGWVEAGEEEFVVAVLVDDDVVDDVVEGVVEEALGDLRERRLTVWRGCHVGGCGGGRWREDSDRWW